MAKININFHDNNYSIDEASLSTAVAELKSHLSTTMSGTGAIINFGGASYNIDSTKLSTVKNDFISHLTTISGIGHKVVIGGVEYYVDADKVKDALAELHGNLVNLIGLDSVEDLERKYEFKYFSTLNDAVDAVNKGTVVENGVENKEGAVAGVYVGENNVHNVVLLKDTTEMYLWPSADMVINLGGHIFTSKDNMAMYCPSNNIYIDGRLPGSGIHVTTTDGVPAQGLMVDSACNLTINGGTYTSIGTNQTSAIVMVRGTVTAQNATFVGKTTTGRMDGFCTYAGSTTNIINCDVLASGGNAQAYGIFVGDNCSVTITGSSIKGYSNYNHNGTSYTASSLGIYQSANSTLTLNDCSVSGTLAGLQTYGTLNVNGGMYEGYGHGGFYFTGKSTKSYVSNATIRECLMPEGYTNNDGTNHVGFYIGTGSGNSIYMDNCTIESNGSAIVLRGSSGDSLYISNSRIGEDRKIRIDSAAQKLYIGVGNNFTADDTTLPSAVITTNETYIMT